MTRRNRSKWLDDSPRSAAASSSLVSPGSYLLLGSSAPAGSAAVLDTAGKEGGHGVAGEPRKRAAYPDANGHTTGATSASPAQLPVPHGARIQVERRRSIEHERYVARALRGHTTPASGALGTQGDVHAPPFAVSCKRTSMKSCDLVTTVEAACMDADHEDLVPAVAFRLEALPDGIEKDWTLIPLRSLSALMTRVTK